MKYNTTFKNLFSDRATNRFAQDTTWRGLTTIACFDMIQLADLGIKT